MSRPRAIDRNVVAAMVASKASNREIAHAVGCLDSSITKVRDELGLGRAQKQTDWTEARIAQLRQWWEIDKLTAGQIARRFGGLFSRNGVMGKIHRLNLDARPSPIIHLDPDEQAARARCRQERRATQRRRDSFATRLQLDFFAGRRGTHPAPNAQRDEVPRGCSESETAGPARVDSGVTPARRTVPQDGGTTTLAKAEKHQCRWPEGPSAGGETIVCGHPIATPGLSWCRHHAERCFQKRADLPAVVPVLRWTMRGALAGVA